MMVIEQMFVLGVNNMKLKISMFDLTYILAFILLVMVFVYFSPMNQSEISPDKYMTITVQTGDTVWELAEQYAGLHTMSAYDFVKWVEEVNGIYEGRIFPGDNLLLPIEQDNLKFIAQK